MKLSYRQLFECPLNYQLDIAICTTMSLDASAAVNLIATANYPECDPLLMTQDQLTVLVNGNMKKRFYFFYDEKKPIKNETTFYSEEILAPILRQAYPIRCNQVFHPKIILVRFISKIDSSKILWRVMISSHNLTLCNVYEVGIVLDSKENSRKGPNHNIYDLLKYIVDNSSREDNDFIKQFEQYASELADLVFVNDTNEFKIELAVSGLDINKQPKLFSDLYQDLINNKEQWFIVSPPYETGKQFQKSNKIFGPYKTEGNHILKELPTHAKMYIHHNGKQSNPIVDQLIIGSSNCSENGLNKNVECLVKISLDKDYNNETFKIEDLDLSMDRESFKFDGTRFERINDFTNLSYEGINILKKVIDNYEFKIEWEKTIDGKPKAKVNINLKSSEGVEITLGEMNALKVLPYSMSEKNSSTAVKKEKWEEFKINRRINFVDAKSTKETQILRLRYDDGFNIHEVLWYDVNNLVNSENVLGKQLDEFFQMPYASLFQRDKELYWSEFWNKYKTFCDVYKNNIDILNVLDRMYRRVWASYCVLSNKNKDIYPIRLPAALDRHIGLMPYQKSVINQVMNSFYERKQKLFLVADEAGLGKTYIAQGVMKAMFKKWNEDKEHKEHKTTTTFNVAYFGSNLFLLDRTAEKLIKRPGGSIDTDFNKLEEIDRFSMIPKVFIESNLYKADKINLFMLSANLIGEIGESKSEDGNDSERQFKKDLIKYFENCKDEHLKEYGEKLKAKNIQEFRNEIADELKRGKTLDLIILDEFHRYDSNVETIIKKIASDDTKVLLLSATPYNWYGSNNIGKGYFIEDEGTGEQSNKKIQTFYDVLNLLSCDDKSTARIKYEEYKEDYFSYKNDGVLGNIKESTKNASDELRKYIWRNERIYASENKRYEIPGQEALSGPEWQEAINGQLVAVNSANAARYKILFPGVYSFAIRTFVSKESEKDVYKDLESTNVEEDDFIFDKDNQLKVDLLKKNLRTESIRRLQVEPMKRMLWLTPSHTMYQPAKPFVKNTTKLLVFSAYKMVPRGIASIFSKYVEVDGQTADASNVDISIEQIKKLDKIINDKNLLSDICDMYTPIYSGEKMNLSWDKFKETLLREKSESLKTILASITNDMDIINIDTLAMYLIAAPLPCLYRIFEDKQKAMKGAFRFYKYFKQQGVNQVLSLAMQDMAGNNELEKLLNYCGAGCLQDMLLEFFALRKDDFEESLKTALSYGGSKVHVLNKDNYKIGIGNNKISSDVESWKVTCRFADRFTPDGSDTGTSGTSQGGREHQRSVQEAFNSPFWPMILSTTSQGQEGIDLDSYCRRIMHYSIPNSPMAFEQRDGRIDRRMSLASRQRMSKLWGGPVCMPECAAKEYWIQLYNQCIDNSGMSPLWSMREDIDDIRIERIIPFVPQSEEDIVYRKLVDLKMRYRRSFGKTDEPGNSIDEYSLKLNDI